MGYAQDAMAELHGDRIIDNTPPTIQEAYSTGQQATPAENRSLERIDRSCLSYWFPLLESAGLPVPRTILVPMSNEAFRDVFRVFDGEEMKGVAEPFFDELRKAADNIGYPCFLRTGQTSGKHRWKETCYLDSPESLRSHVVNIVEFSECVDLIGLPCDVWAVRELLPTMPLGASPCYSDLPLCREFRFFVADGEVKCWHHYWPLESLARGGADLSLYDQLTSTEGYADAYTLAHKAARAVEGAWSVDVLETQRGWYITDMAEAHKSWHEEGCEEFNVPERDAEIDQLT